MSSFWFSAMGQQQGEKFNCAPTSFGEQLLEMWEGETSSCPEELVGGLTSYIKKDSGIYDWHF